MTLKIHETGEGEILPPDDGLEELRRLWPGLAPRVKDAVLVLASSAAGITPSGELPLMLGVEHLAELLGVSRTTVDRMDDEARIPAPIRAGRSKKWERDGFLSWLRTRRPNGETFTRAEWARLSN